MDESTEYESVFVFQVRPQSLQNLNHMFIIVTMTPKVPELK